MFKTRIILFVASAIIIWLIFLLPKVVVDNDSALTDNPQDSAKKDAPAMHSQAPKEVMASIRNLRVQLREGAAKEKNAIFADSLAKLYQIAGKFDSAAWFAEEASTFLNTTESWIQAGDLYYQAYSFAVDKGKQNVLAEKTRELYGKALEANPKNLDIKTKMAMTYVTSASPMAGITMLREVLAEDPKNELALYNMGMLSFQSGQYDKAVERLEALVKINPKHTQAQMLLGIAWINLGDKAKAKAQLEKVKQMDDDPAVQATVDSYLKDLK
ncbi:tetratricopeptide repeat protein [Chryseolinea lacunae]|uniref:Tetratricopeptide repeat protein n=1 Tax=Chryseolinea lacunae TaxID=2801331 RepID=A0ABS1KRJ6_9BACT|nr:tetratricopeptide repeat protein [Chryseolinea lacunae]MBL0741837.1 tetratricopeptide repeat protein [Chryseolinea lacunae]